MKRLFFTSTIRKKITIIVTLSIVIIFGCFSFGLQWIKRQWEEQVLETTEKSIDIVSNDWIRLSTEIKKEAKQLLDDDNVAAYLRSDDDISSELISSKVSEMLFDFAIRLSYTKSLCIIKSPNEYIIRNLYRYSFTDDYVAEFCEYCSSIRSPSFMIDKAKDGTEFLLYIEPVYIHSSRNKQGYLLLYIEKAEMDNIFATLNDKYSSFVLLDSNKDVVYQGGINDCFDEIIESANYLQNTGEGVQNLSDKLLLYKNFQLNQWAICTTIDIKKLFHEVNQTITLLTILTGVLSILTLAIILHSFSTYYQKIEALNATSIRVKNGYLEDRYVIDGTDEIAQIGSHFNEMLDVTEELIAKDAIKEIKLKEAQLSVLRHQINPHFLYNTLDTIRMLAVRHGDTQIKCITEDLADIFRYSLDDRDSDTCLVRSEIESIKRYVRIQDARFHDSFTYDFIIDSDILDLRMYKFLLQPILENAFIHGINMSNKPSDLLVRGYRSENRLCFEISNTGVPIEPDILKNLQDYAVYNNEKHDIPAPSGIGLRNVIDRIHIYFGEEGAIEIKSNKDVGTLIKICFPFL